MTSHCFTAAYYHTKKKGSCTNMCTIIRLQPSCRINAQPLELELADVYLQHMSMILNYRVFIKTAATARAIFQDARVEELALAGDAEASLVCKRVKNIEMSRSQHHRIKSMLCNQNMTGVT